MSYDFNIVTFLRPSEGGLRAFVSEHGGLLVRGSWTASSDPTLYVASGNDDSDVLLIIEAPTDLADLDDFSDHLATLVGARWITRITVPIGSGKYGRAVGRTIADYLAKEHDGAAYDPQRETYIVKPKKMAPPASTSSSQVRDIVRVHWTFPIELLSVAALERFNDIVRSLVPGCEISEMRDTLLRKRMVPDSNLAAIIDHLHDRADVDRMPIAAVWKPKWPGIEGIVAATMNDSHRWLVPAWSLELVVDRDAVTEHPRWLFAIENAFVQIARDIGAAYGASYGCKDVVVSREGLGFTDITLDYVVPTWAGLPEFVPWMAWYGKSYMNYVHAGTAAQVERYNDGILLRQSALPEFEAGGDVKNTAVPSELIQRSGRRRRETVGGQLPGVTIWYEPDKAKVLPPLAAG